MRTVDRTILAETIAAAGPDPAAAADAVLRRFVLVERVAVGGTALTDLERKFLLEVAAGGRAGGSGDEANKAKQSLRKRGFISHEGVPKRWIATPRGASLADELRSGMREAGRATEGRS